MFTPPHTFIHTKSIPSQHLYNNLTHMQIDTNMVNLQNSALGLGKFMLRISSMQRYIEYSNLATSNKLIKFYDVLLTPIVH